MKDYEVVHLGSFLQGQVVSRILHDGEDIAWIISDIEGDNLRNWNTGYIEDGVYYGYGISEVDPLKDVRAAKDENDGSIGIPQPHKDRLDAYLWQLDNA